MAAPPQLTDSICLQTPSFQLISPSAAQPRPDHILIYFIPGNPGLIEFYRPFLTHLHAALKHLPDDGGPTVTIAGNSLAGFHVNGSKNQASDGKTRLPLNLRQQIEDVERQVSEASIEANWRLAFGDLAEKPMGVILIGHSVGAYILMSLLERQTQPRKSREGNPRYFNIIAGICLFPTVVDLYASPNGRKASWMAHIPAFSILLQMLTKVLCWGLPFSILMSLVQKVTGQLEAAARVTASFLASATGVRQAIYLAQHELLEMREDKWSDDVWGTGTSTSTGPSFGVLGPSETASAAATPRSGQRTLVSTKPGERRMRPSLFFYFGSSDNWISNNTRDNIIATRAATSPSPVLHSNNLNALKSLRASQLPRSGPRIEISTHNIPHDFCVTDENSVLVANKVAGYVQEVLSNREAEK